MLLNQLYSNWSKFFSTSTFHVLGRRCTNVESRQIFPAKSERFMLGSGLDFVVSKTLHVSYKANVGDSRAGRKKRRNKEQIQNPAAKENLEV